MTLDLIYILSQTFDASSKWSLSVGVSKNSRNCAPGKTLSTNLALCSTPERFDFQSDRIWATFCRCKKAAATADFAAKISVVSFALKEFFRIVFYGPMSGKFYRTFRYWNYDRVFSIQFLDLGRNYLKNELYDITYIVS